MQLTLLDAIVRVRAELLFTNKCSKDFVMSPRIVDDLTSDKVYNNTANSSLEEKDDLKLFFQIFMLVS